jgi:hypothetical protein
MMIGLANGEKASPTEHMRRIVRKTGIKRAVIGIGIHSVTHQTTINRNTDKRWWALGFWGRIAEK